VYLQDTFPSLSVYKWVREDNKQHWLKCKIYISSSSLAGFFILFVLESSKFFLCFRFLPTREHKILIKRRLKTVQMRTYVYSFVYGFVCQFYSSVLLHSSFPHSGSPLFCLCFCALPKHYRLVHTCFSPIFIWTTHHHIKYIVGNAGHAQFRLKYMEYSPVLGFNGPVC